MSVFDVENRANHTEVLAFLDPTGGPTIQRYDTLKYKSFDSSGSVRLTMKKLADIREAAIIGQNIHDKLAEDAQPARVHVLNNYFDGEVDALVSNCDWKAFFGHLEGYLVDQAKMGKAINGLHLCAMSIPFFQQTMMNNHFVRSSPVFSASPVQGLSDLFRDRHVKIEELLWQTDVDARKHFYSRQFEIPYIKKVLNAIMDRWNEIYKDILIRVDYRDDDQESYSLVFA